MAQPARVMGKSNKPSDTKPSGSTKKGGATAAGDGPSTSGRAGGGAASAGGYSLDIREGAVALLRFKTRDGMNAMLDPLSNAVEVRRSPPVPVSVDTGRRLPSATMMLACCSR